VTDERVIVKGAGARLVANLLWTPMVLLLGLGAYVGSTDAVGDAYQVVQGSMVAMLGGAGGLSGVAVMLFLFGGVDDGVPRLGVAAWWCMAASVLWVAITLVVTLALAVQL